MLQKEIGCKKKHRAFKTERSESEIRKNGQKRIQNTIHRLQQKVHQPLQFRGNPTEKSEQISLLFFCAGQVWVKHPIIYESVILIKKNQPLNAGGESLLPAK